MNKIPALRALDASRTLSAVRIEKCLMVWECRSVDEHLYNMHRSWVQAYEPDTYIKRPLKQYQISTGEQNHTKQKPLS